MLGKNIFNLRADTEIGMAKDGVVRNSFAMTLLQIIQRDYIYSARQQHLTANTADIACGPSNQNVQ